MRGTGSTVQRQWEILRLLPRHLYAISTTDIHDKLRSIGYEVSKRTIERDLASLEQQFPLRCEERGRTHLWSWHKDAQVAQVPGMASTEALTLLLAGDYLRDLLPDGLITDVEPYLERAESTIAGTKLRDWRSKVRRLGGSPTLIPPDVAPEVRRTVFEGLFAGASLQVSYLPRAQAEPTSLLLHPLALVIRDGVYYLIARAWSYDDIRHYALHRIQRAELDDTADYGVESFDLDAYIESDNGFDYPLNARQIGLEFLIETYAGQHLLERSLSDDQRVLEMSDQWLRIRATVPDTLALRWWLLGFGDRVKVLQPESLREEIYDTARRMQTLYRSDS